MSRRTRTDIIKEILELCSNPVNKTAIVYSCNLNFKIVKKYLSWCFINGWLKQTGNKYQTTVLGNDYLNILIPVVKLIQF